MLRTSTTEIHLHILQRRGNKNIFKVPLPKIHPPPIGVELNPSYKGKIVDTDVSKSIPINTAILISVKRTGC